MNQENKDLLNSQGVETEQKPVTVESAFETKPASLPGVMTMLSQAWGTYEQQFKTLIAIYFIPLAFMLLASLIPGYDRWFFSVFSPEGFNPWPLVLYVFQLLFVYLAFAAHIYLLKEKRGDIGAIEAYRGSLRKFPPYLWVLILFMLVTTLGFAFFVIPGIIFTVWFALAAYIVISENVGAVEAMARSRNYVKGYWWAVFGRLLFIWFVFMAIFFVLFMPISFALTLIMSFFPNLPLFFIGSSILPLIASLITFPLMIIYFNDIYSRLKLIKGEPAANLSKRSTNIVVNIIAVLLLVLSMIGFGLFARFASYMNYQETPGAADQETGFGDTNDATLDMENIRMIFSALKQYQEINGSFPMSLNDLMPDFLDTIPLDTTGNLYVYEQTLNGEDFNLCHEVDMPAIFGGPQRVCYTTADTWLFEQFDFQTN